MDSVSQAPPLVSADVTAPKIRIAFGLPIYGGTGFASFFFSLFGTIDLLRQHGIESYPIVIMGESLITRGRNNIVAKFMNDPKATHLMFIDSDIVWNPIDVLKLIKHDKQLVSGCYPLKTLQIDQLSKMDEIKTRHQLACNKDINEYDFIKQNLLKYNLNFKYNNFKIVDNLCEVRHTATGFMLIQRPLIEALIRAHPETKYDCNMKCLSPDEGRFSYALFDCSIDKNRNYLSEDHHFCNLASELGENVYVDVSINLTHIGTYAYEGRFLSSLNLNFGDKLAENVSSNEPASPVIQKTVQDSNTKSQPLSIGGTTQPNPNIDVIEYKDGNSTTYIINSKNTETATNEPDLTWVKDLEDKLAEMTMKKVDN